MLTDELSIVVVPQFGGLIIIGHVPAGALLVIVMIKWSPGFTCSVGFCKPSGVMKQNNSLPLESIRCWYEKRTFSTPSELKSATGFCTTLPASGRTQGLATGGTRAALEVAVAA
jgi:hypothetical protein